MNYLVPSRLEQLKQACNAAACMSCSAPRAELKLQENMSFTGAGESEEGGEWGGGSTPPGKSLPVFAASLTWSSSHPSHEVTEHWKGVTLNREVPSTHWSSEDSEQQQKKKEKEKTIFFFILLRWDRMKPG